MSIHPLFVQWRLDKHPSYTTLVYFNSLVEESVERTVCWWGHKRGERDEESEEGIGEDADGRGSVSLLAGTTSPLEGR